MNIRNLNGISEILDFALYVVLDAAVFPFQHILIVNGLIGSESLDLLVQEFVLELLHLRQDSLDATCCKLSSNVYPQLQVSLGRIDYHVDKHEGRDGIFHKQVLHSNTTSPQLFTGADQTSHLAPAIDGNLDQAHPSIKSPIFS
ncbi:hypothetical protein HG531_003412 [Fusarium graminearum]|nr:hypothetical protein HG531_003412 [Fusarium graminearum]